jgi:CPA2 family monovalent cation:H+ antiporter-2
MLGASVFAVALVLRLGGPPVLGYLLVGLLLGASGFGLIPHSEQLHRLAELGVVFLLFTVGLELSLRDLWAMRQTVFGLGAAQVLATTLIVSAAALLAGLSWETALVAGGALAMSSTAVIVRQLRDQRELHAPHGRLALSVLLFQDVAVVPFLLVLPVLAGGPGSGLGAQLAATLALGAATIAGLLVLGRWLVRPALHRLARLGSEELFMLATLLAALAAAAVTHAAGLSLALGAFAAGLVLAESDLRHRIERTVRPFRDLFMGLFFLMVGLMVDLRASLGVLHWVLALALAMTLGKAVLVYLLARLWRVPARPAARAAAALGPGGEFGLTLVVLAITSGLMGPQSAQPLLAAIVLSMVGTPFLVRAGGSGPADPPEDRRAAD